MGKTKRIIAALTAAIITATSTSLMSVCADNGEVKKSTLQETAEEINEYMRSNGISGYTYVQVNGGTENKLLIVYDGFLDKIQAYVTEKGIDYSLVEYRQSHDDSIVSDRSDEEKTPEKKYAETILEYMHSNSIQGGVSHSTDDKLLTVSYRGNYGEQLKAYIEELGLDENNIKYELEELPEFIAFNVTTVSQPTATTIAVTETKPVTTITMPVLDDPTIQTAVVTVTIMDISGDNILVKPVDGSPELKSSSKFYLSSKKLPDDIKPKVSMKLEITYNGGILETYPAQFGNVKKVVEVKEDTVKEDPTLLKGTKDMTLNDVMRLAELGDELDWADFKDYNGKDVGSGLYIWEYKLEDGYVLDVGGTTSSKPLYILLSRNNEKGIDIRTENVKEYIAATAVPVFTEKDTITEFGTGGLWSDPENSDFILKNMTLNDVIELSIKSDTVVLKWSDFTDYKGEDISSESSLLEKEWTFKIDDEYILKVCGKTDVIFPDHVYLSDNSKRRIDICTDDVKAFLNKGIGEDSLSISEDIKEHFRVYETYSDENTKPERRLVQDFKSIMRYYNVPVRFVFKEYDNIDDILASAYATKKYYVVKQHDGTLQCYNEHLKEMKSNRQTIKNGETLTLPYLDIPEKAFERFNDPDFVKNYISPDVNVENVYYLSGESSHMGTAIYYRTDKGDYVYYNHYSIGEKLFPIEDFCKYQKAISDELAKHSDENGSGDIDISDLMDLSKYELKNTTSTSESLKGDANCDGQVDLSDAVMIMQALANPNKYGIDGTADHHLTEQGKLNGDMDGDGLTVGDAQAIQRKLLGLENVEAQSVESFLTANAGFLNEKGTYTLFFIRNGNYFSRAGGSADTHDEGTWTISGDTVVLTGKFGTNRLSFDDNALIYIAECSDGFNDFNPKDGEKFNAVFE